MWARTGGRKKISFTKFFNASIVDRGNLRGPPPQWNPIEGFLRTAMILRLLRALFLVNFLGAKLYNSCPSFAFSFWRALEMPLMMVWGMRLYFFFSSFRHGCLDKNDQRICLHPTALAIACGCTRKGIPEVTRYWLMGAQISHVTAFANDVGMGLLSPRQP